MPIERPKRGWQQGVPGDDPAHAQQSRIDAIATNGGDVRIPFVSGRTDSIQVPSTSALVGALGLT